MDEKKLEKAQKAALKLNADLIGQQQKRPTKALQTSDVKKCVKRIKDNIEIMTDSKIQIIEDLNYLQKHQEELTEMTGLTFEAFLKEFTRYSKSYFYQLTGNYDFLKENNKIELLDKVDTKIIEEIKKIDDTEIQKEYLEKAETLTRADIRVMRDRVRPSDSAQEAPGQAQKTGASITPGSTEKAYYRLLNVIERYINKHPEAPGIKTLKIDIENIKNITGEK